MTPSSIRSVVVREFPRRVLLLGAFAASPACSSADESPPSSASGGVTQQGGSSSGGIAAGGITGGAMSAGTGGGGMAQGGTAEVTGGAAPSSGTAGVVLGGAGGAEAGGAGAGGANTGGLAPGPCQPPIDTKNPPEKLSETGCMNPANPTELADFVIPYEVNSPLWSDGANKERGMVIPAGQKVHVKNCSANPDECRFGPQDDGQWEFPVGSVLIKNFAFDDKLVETRLFVRRDTKTWVGYGYQWNEAQTEATVVPDEARTVTFNTGQRTVSWTYPSRYDCMLCHNKFAGYTLGTETKQLNRMMGSENLLDRLGRLGIFDAPLAQPYIAPLPAPYTVQEGSPPAGASNEQLTRSYLHSNCSFCHRADGNPGTLDLRLGISLSEMNACNVAPQKGPAGLAVATLLTPGKPQESVIWARVQTLDEQARMPQIATYVVDEPAVSLIADWITGIQACP